MKKFKLIVGAVALFALVVANVWNAATTLKGSDLEITNVESIAAEAEGDVNGGSGYYEDAVRSPEDCIADVPYVRYYCGTEVRFNAKWNGQTHRCSSCEGHTPKRIKKPGPGQRISCVYKRDSKCNYIDCLPKPETN